MASRLELQALLVDLLGSSNVYFQPPPSKQMQYPCIVYKRDYTWKTHSGNKPYTIVKRYSVTVIDKDPDSLIPDKIAQLSMSEFERFFAADGLNHDVYNVYF